MVTRGAGRGVAAALAVLLAAAGCGVEGDGGTAAGGSGSTTTTTAAVSTTSTSVDSTTTTAEPTTTTAAPAEDALAAVQAGVQAVADAGTGRYRASLHVTATGVDSTIEYEGTWDAEAGLLQVVMRIVSPDEASELTILNDGSGALYLRQPELTGDAARPWVRLDPEDLGEGGDGIGIPPAPGPGDPPTPLTVALSGATAASAAGDGFRVEVTGRDALVLASSPAILGGLGGVDLDAIHAALPPTVAIDVVLDGDGRLAGGAAGVDEVADAVLGATGGVAEGTGPVEADYEEEILALGGPVDIRRPDPSEVVDGG